VATRTTIGSAAIHGAIAQIAEAIAARHPAPARLIVLGIANGGLPLARRISARLAALAPKLSVRIGSLDVSFHRDDIGENPIPKEFTPTIIPGDVNGATVILVDDVLFSGRTAKAALDELFDQGRPATVELAVLADRGGRKLPIQADYVGLTLDDVHLSKEVIISLDENRPAHDEIRIVADGKRP
jgi:pyrimidine operon attenuation protein/uracil phosphoribosyltransferase